MREFYDRFMPAREWIDEHISIQRGSGRDAGLEITWYRCTRRSGNYVRNISVTRKSYCTVTINNILLHPIQHDYEINTGH